MRADPRQQLPAAVAIALSIFTASCSDSDQGTGAQPPAVAPAAATPAPPPVEEVPVAAPEPVSEPVEAVTESVTAPAEPAGPAETVVASAAGTPPAAATAPAEEAAPAAPVDGREVYNQVCAVCHRAGLNAAPKYGAKFVWPRVLAKGREQVYKNSLQGIRGMPPRGGVASLTDEQVKAAVDYMVNGSGGWGNAPP